MLKWSESFRIGVPEIDDAHRRMLCIARNLGSTIETRDFERASELIDEFVSVSCAHFREEERYLAEVGYEDVEAHAEHHSELLDRVKAFRDTFESARAREAVRGRFHDLAVFFVDEVIAGDMRFKSFLDAKGLTE